jgi:hypothetical protein
MTDYCRNFGQEAPLGAAIELSNERGASGRAETRPLSGGTGLPTWSNKITAREDGLRETESPKAIRVLDNLTGGG